MAGQRWTGVGLFGLAAMGCAPVLSTFTPAAVTPGPFHFRGGLAMGASVPVGQVSEAIETGQALATRVENGETLTDADRQRLFNSLGGLVIAPPGLSPELHARMGLGSRADIGVRTTFSDIRIDGRYQLLDAARHPFDLSVGLGLSYTSVSFPLGSEFSSVVDAQGFSSLGAEVPVLAGWSGRFGAFWFGPKFMVRGFSAGMNVRTSPDESALALASLDGTSLYAGGQIGGMFGFRWIFLAAELTVMGMTSSGRVSVNNGSYRSALEFGGLVVAPTFGIILQI